MQTNAEGWLTLAVILLIALAIWHGRQFRPNMSACGTARWANRCDLRRLGMYAAGGLLLGRDLVSGALIWMHRYVHLAIFSPAGGGKSTGLAVPWLLTWRRGSAVVLDVKGELYRLTASARRAMGQTVVRLDPYGVCGDGGDSFNPLDLVSDNPEACIDDSRAFSEALVIRGEEKEAHWNDQAANILTALLSFIASNIEPAHRTLACLRDIICNPGKPPDHDGKGGSLSGVDAVAALLRDKGGSFANLGGVIAAVQDKERSSVLSTINRHSTFADSPAITRVTSSSSFDPRKLLDGRMTIYLVLPGHQLEAQARWLRLVISSFIRLIGREGMKNGKECLAVLDEAGQLGPMESIDMGLTLFRGQGLRMAFFFQSLGQLSKVFKERQAVLLDNCETIWFGTQSLESAQRVSQMCGEQTIVVEGAGESHSTQEQSQQPFPQRGSSWSRDYKVQARALLKVEEVLALPGTEMVCFLKNLPPLLCRRIAYYSDPYFRRWGGLPVAWWIALAATIGLAAWMVWGK